MLEPLKKCEQVLSITYADFLQRLLKNKDRKLAQPNNYIFRYIDDALSLNIR
jgi:hypothetical protein